MALLMNILDSRDKTSAEILVRDVRHKTCDFPTDARAYLERVILILEEEDDWNIQFVLLYLLSLLLMTPFKLTQFGDDIQKRVHKLMFKCVDSHTDSVKKCAVSLFKRNDANKKEFIDACDLTRVSHVQVLAAVFKHCNLYDFEIIDRIKPQNDSPLHVRSVLTIVAYSMIESHVLPVLELLRNGLGHYDSRVRWCSAKLLSRVSRRLSISVTDSIIESIRNEWTQNDYQWEGSCLCIAECTRQKLLSLEQIPTVIEIIKKCLTFGATKGSIGSHVRDAACFVAWSLSRVTKLTQSYVWELLNELIPIALFDYEVNVRRASAAAIHEIIGRTRTENAYELIEMTDWNELSLRQDCYRVLCNRISNKDIRESMRNHLRQFKVVHNDVSVRSDAAYALAMLTDNVESLYNDCVEMVLTGDLNTRHGALLIITELLSRGHTDLRVATIADSLIERNLLRGFSGQIMRNGICRMSAQTTDVSEKTINCVIETAFTGDGNADAIEAIRVHSNNVIPQLIHRLVNGDVTIGVIRSLTAVVTEIPDPNSVMKMLEIIMLRKDGECELRAECVNAAVALNVSHEQIERILLIALRDNYRDDRGDVSSVIRESACNCITRIKHVTDPMLTVAVATQCLSPILRLRIAASHAFIAITGQTYDDTDWSKEHESARVMFPLLNDPQYTASLWNAIVSRVRPLKTEFIAYIRKAPDHVIEVFVKNLRPAIHWIETAYIMINDGNRNDDILVSRAYILSKNAILKCDKINTIIAAVSLLRAIIPYNSDALMPLVEMLDHRYPRVRQHAASELLIALMGEDRWEHVIESIMQIDWLRSDSEAALKIRESFL